MTWGRGNFGQLWVEAGILQCRAAPLPPVPDVMQPELRNCPVSTAHRFSLFWKLGFPSLRHLLSALESVPTAASVLTMALQQVQTSSPGLQCLTGQGRKNTQLSSQAEKKSWNERNLSDWLPQSGALPPSCHQLHVLPRFFSSQPWACLWDLRPRAEGIRLGSPWTQGFMVTQHPFPPAQVAMVSPSLWLISASLLLLQRDQSAPTPLT